MMPRTPIDFAQAEAGAKLYERAMRSFDRLESDKYRPDTVFQDGKYSWPGDWEGRTLLGLTLLAQATKREPAYLDEMMDRLPEHLNERGYFGPIRPPGVTDEQQLAGNSWLLRAMAEYYMWRKDERAYEAVKSIVTHLLLPARGRFASYPVEPEQRTLEGEASGTLQERRVNGWLLSTDIGCAFIMLDGASQAYQLLGWPELGELLREMAELFVGLDLPALSFQTHATLSALRGLLRFCETVPDARLLSRAEDIFRLYCGQAMTENYANYNWFGRPQWTEPCAVIDSYIAAVMLWQHTGRTGYLDTAQHILHNAMGYGQRPNGGFGCDTCAGAHDTLLSPKPNLFEAYWCCTMRGGEGLAQAIRYGYFQDGDGISVVSYQPGVARFELPQGGLKVAQRTEYPVDGVVRLVVEESSLASPISIRFYIPSWTDQASVRLRVNGEERPTEVRGGLLEASGAFPAGTELELSFEVSLREEAAFNPNSIPGVRSFRHGPLLLGLDNLAEPAALPAGSVLRYLGDGAYQVEDGSLVLKPLYDMMDRTEEEARSDTRQVLFAAL
jgi:hypothetical protein